MRRATGADHSALRSLLENAGLPTADLDAALVHDFLVIDDAQGSPCGCVGIERHGDDALLRSLVVAPDARGAGSGARLVEAAEAHAAKAGCRAIYLLTTTAAEYFPRFGFVELSRAELPPAIAASEEAATLCPASARCFTKALPSGS